jgi:hypothetical protein
MTSLHEEFQELTSDAHEIEKKVIDNVNNLLS